MIANSRWWRLAVVALVAVSLTSCKPRPVPTPPAVAPAAHPVATVTARSAVSAKPVTVALPAANAKLQAARLVGWKLAQTVLQSLEESDQTDFPGIQSWLDDYRAVAQAVDRADPAALPSFDVEKLVTNNPNFWRAHYEIAPGDIGLNSLHAGLLLAAGEAQRAQYLLAIAEQAPGIPAELRQHVSGVIAHCDRAAEDSNALVAESIKLHDAGDYPAAVAKLKEALALWPQNGFAHYELGLTLFQQERRVAGEPELPGTTKIQINSGLTPPAEVLAEYALARRHDPFQYRAWQGTDREVIEGLLPLLQKGMPAWEKLTKTRPKPVPDETLEQLVAGLQESGTHDLALVARQVLIARRGRYASADHPFMALSLRKLVPGDDTEALLELLDKGPIKARQIVVPESNAWQTFLPDRGKPTDSPPDDSEAAPPAKLNSVRLYIPIPQLEERLGKDPNRIVNYIKTLEKRTSEIIGEQPAVPAKGLLIAVGFQSKTKTRIWCQPVEGELPAELLKQLEQELAAVDAFDLLQSPAAFGLEINLRGQTPEEFPEFPDTWLEAAKTNDVPLSPPDELFKIIWPD